MLRYVDNNEAQVSSNVTQILVVYFVHTIIFLLVIILALR